MIGRVKGVGSLGCSVRKYAQKGQKKKIMFTVSFASVTMVLFLMI